MPTNEIRIGVLASGRGSNFEALLRHAQSGCFERARFVCLLSNNPAARALDLAREHNIPAQAFRPRDFASLEAYEQQLLTVLQEHQVDLVALAGYMRIIGQTLLARFPSAVLNIHPSLLPSFPGLHAQQQALQHGVKVSGCTVHFVDSGMDTGPIVGQRTVPVLDTDDEDALSARILEQEHQLYAESIKRVTEQPWRIEGRRVVFG